MLAATANCIVRVENPSVSHLIVSGIEDILTSFLYTMASLEATYLGGIESTVTYYAMWAGIQAFCIYFVQGQFSKYDKTLITNYCDSAALAEVAKSFVVSITI